tara:strand:- start:286 stop:705 length:420 start_codon:yes stop_codon:yes gene_type:complete
MEVKVQYTVDLEQIPREVIKLVPEAVELENRLSNIVSLVEDCSYSLAIDEMESLRLEMYKIDQRLADCQGILKGYLSVKNRPSAQQSQQNADMPPMENGHLADMNKLQSDFEETLRKMSMAVPPAIQNREEGAQDDSAS